MYYKYNLYQLLYLSKNKNNNVIVKESSFRQHFRFLENEQILYGNRISIPYCRSPEVASSVASRLPLFFSFSPSPSFLFLFLLLLPLFFQQHFFHPRIKQRGLHSITRKSDASFPMYSSLILCIYFYPTRALYPILWDVCVDIRMTHSCSRSSTIFLFLFFSLFLQHVSSKSGQ